MANLLPQDKKKKIRKEYRLRAVTVSLSVFGIVSVITVVLLSSLYILLNSRLSSLDQMFAVTSEERKDLAELKQKMNDTRTELKLLQHDDSLLKIPYGIFKTIFDIKSENIFLTEIAYSNSQIIVGGFALYREDLQDFVVTIGNHKLFLPVEYPFSNITKKEDIDFSLTINMATDNEK